MRKRSLKFLGGLDTAVAGFLLGCLIVLTFAGVFRRYIFGNPIVWMEEVQMLLFLWVTYLGAGVAFRECAHVSIDILVDIFPKKLRSIVEKIDVLIELAILAYLFTQGTAYYIQLVGAGKQSTLLRIPFSIAYLVIPVGGALMMISMLYNAYQEHFARKSEEVSL